MPVFYYSLQHNFCYLCKSWRKDGGRGEELGHLFYCLILFGINTLTRQRDDGWNYSADSVDLNVTGAFLGGNAYKRI